MYLALRDVFVWNVHEAIKLRTTKENETWTRQKILKFCFHFS